MASLAQDNLVAALKARFLSDPKLINEVVTGACTWPAEDSLDDLLAEANNMLDDRIEIPMPLTSVGMDIVQAAIEALAELVADAAEKRRLADEAYEERSGYITEHHGWQGVL